MRGLVLRSQVAVDGGELHLENSSFVDSSAALGGALQVSGGRLVASDAAFAGCSAARGGAVHVSGGDAIFTTCSFEGCAAYEAQGGGAVWVEGTGSVVLRATKQQQCNHSESHKFSIARVFNCASARWREERAGREIYLKMRT